MAESNESPPDDVSPQSRADAETDADAHPTADLTTQVQTLQEEVDRLERLVTRLATRQARENGKSICPACEAAGALYREPTASGKLQISCRNCGEAFR